MAAHVGINNTPCAFQRLARFPSCNTAFQLRIGRVCNTVKAIAERRDNLDHLQRVTHVQPQPQQKKKTGKVSIPGKIFTLYDFCQTNNTDDDDD